MKSSLWPNAFWRLAIALFCTLTFVANLPSAEEASKPLETLYKEAAAAQVKMQFAQQELQRAAASLATAKTAEDQLAAEIEQLTKAQAVVAKRFEDAAPATSPFDLARAALATAQEQLAAIRKERPEDARAIAAARDAVHKAAAQWKRAREELLRGSVEWTQAEADLSRVGKQHGEAETARHQAEARHLALKGLANAARTDLIKAQTELLKAQTPPKK